jgi:hypothetical protein
LGVKNFEPVLDGESASKWVRIGLPKFKNIDYPNTKDGLEVKQTSFNKHAEGAFGCFVCDSNTVEKNASFVSLLTMRMSSHLGTVPIFPENFMNVCALFAARKSIKSTWVNYKDVYSIPDILNKDYKQWNGDAVVYSLFNNDSKQVSLRNVLYNGKNYPSIKNEFFFVDVNKMRDFANDCGFDEMYRDADGSDNRYIYKLLQNLPVSKLASDVLESAQKLCLLSVEKRIEYHNDYSVHNLQCWDAGWYQIKKVLKRCYPEELNKFGELYNVFNKQMVDGVYKFGFLPDESIEEVNSNVIGVYND